MTNKSIAAHAAQLTPEQKEAIADPSDLLSDLRADNKYFAADLISALLSQGQPIERITELESDLASERSHRLQAQNALMFWLPMVPDSPEDVSKRVAHDAMLLMGYEGDNEKSAEELGWISLAAPPGAAQPPKYESIIDDAGKVIGVRFMNAEQMPPYRSAATVAQPIATGQNTPTGDQLRAIVKSLRGSSDGPSLSEAAFAGWMAAMKQTAASVSAQPNNAGGQNEMEWRKLLAMTYCPPHLLYSDDGELQDNRAHPFIDFKRDNVGQILTKIQHRSNANDVAIAVAQPIDIAIRNQVLEEAAMKCDGLATLYCNPCGFDEGYTMASTRAAAEIRAMKSQPVDTSVDDLSEEQLLAAFNSGHTIADGLFEVAALCGKPVSKGVSHD